jgi:peroxisomal enoyl-CoA hydratase 2
MTIRLPRVRRFPIEAGHIQLFARAIGDSNPIYSDQDYASQSSLGGIIAPPTFSEASNHFDEDWPFRPSWGPLPLNSTAPRTDIEPDNGNRGTALHAETHFVYHRPVRPGMVLSVNARLGRQWKKWGKRSGELKFHEIVSEFHADGTPVLDCTTVVLRTERIVSGQTTPVTGAVATEANSYPPTSFLEKPRRHSSLRVADKIEAVLVQKLSRAQIVQYAGASGDFSLQHVDEFYNTRVAGYPSVFAHGMLTMGMVGRVLTDIVCDGRLRKFGFQFRQQVWPGDSLFCVVTVTGLTTGIEGTIDLAMGVTNQNGELIGSGYANAAVADQDTPSI